MIKDYLNSVIEEKSSKDFIVFSAVIFSIGFVLSIISNAFFFIDHPVVKVFIGIANTVFFIGVVGVSIVISKWFKNTDEKLYALANLYLTFTLIFAFMSYFVPFLFLVTVALIIALILTAKKFILGEEKLLVGKTVSYFLITLSFYTMELVTELNEQIIRR
ncbi:hypothetical protein SAMN04488510_10932 [Fervidobacterium changbaicum]|uniref:Uncharacterized protein n=2 Tax=Fervidobacterium TaxID=2422 RepID=A0AAI8CLI7_FERIS|nr:MULTISPECIES: hypothetical protein [Fervidobacterium]AMW32451.1 hypothetical protein NA23_03515 [Fervidobacterium islandicum]QAV33971.1 hypothetical protein CBS1_09845 [Fervidobacterium changbaicum]SDH25209.1 hypothetical protein SAMN04488510_10932 [Fervidobacterium changbaicum]